MGRKQDDAGRHSGRDASQLRQRKSSFADWPEKGGSEDRSEKGGSMGSGNVRAKKHLGQHFLMDLNIARKISDSLTICGVAQHSKSGSCKITGESTVQLSKDINSDQHSNGGSFEAMVDTASNPALLEVTEGTASRPAAVLNITEGGAFCPAALETASTASCPASVLEVGPGMGVLTQFLLQRDDIELYAAEIDAESVEYLHAKFPHLTPRLFEEDFLKMDLAGRFPEGVRIIGNFPYNISSQIFFKVLENRDLVPEVVGMVQREVAVRIAEPPGSREYGILSVLLQAWYDIEYLFTVNENVFVPPPKVKSGVIRLKRNETKKLDCDEKLFVKVVKASFGQRRKMLKNSLKAVFGDFGGDEHQLFTTRAEQLSVADFVELTRWVSERISPGIR